MDVLLLLAPLVGCIILFPTAIWLFINGVRLSEANERLAAHRALLQSAAAEARDTFLRYEVIHAAKNTTEGEAKAMANRRLADRMQSALTRTGYQELGPLQKAVKAIGDRFRELNGQVS